MQTAQPIADSKRTAIVDILRGWAILGVVIGNYADYHVFGHEVKRTSSIVSGIFNGLHQAFFAAKSWTLLSVLFGYGFAVVMSNMMAKGKNPIAFFSRRMFWLLVIALINSAFWFGDILKDYAVLGLLLMLFYRASAKTAFWAGAVLLFALPFIVALVNHTLIYDYMGAVNKHYLPQLYSHNPLEISAAHLKGTYYMEMLYPAYAINVHVMMFACMLLGFAGQKWDLFNRLPEYKKQLKLIFWASIVAGIVLGFGMGMLSKFKSPLLSYFRPSYWIIFCTMMMIMTGICWIYINGKLKAFFSALQVMGKMTLTNYMVQNILAWFLFLNVGLGLFNTMPFWFYFVVAVVVFIIQIFISRWWLKHYNYGPVEWVWRQLSYGKRLPIKKQTAETSL